MAAFMRKKIPTFSPTNISGCQVWFDAADPSTIVAPTGPVLSWTSKGGSAMTATPSGTAPTYTKYNGFPGIAFNGTSTKMLTGTISSFGTTGSTWIAVSVNFRPVSSTLPPDASVVMATSGGTGPERAIRYNSTTAATSYSINMEPFAKTQETTPTAFADLLIRRQHLTLTQTGRIRPLTQRR